MLHDSWLQRDPATTLPLQRVGTDKVCRFVKSPTIRLLWNSPGPRLLDIVRPLARRELRIHDGQHRRHVRGALRPMLPHQLAPRFRELQREGDVSICAHAVDERADHLHSKFAS